MPPYGWLLSISVAPVWPSVSPEMGALPLMMSPPQYPDVASSLSAVNTIGLSAVPRASILPPCATSMYLSKPLAALILVPAGIWRVAPSGTVTVPVRWYTLFASSVVVPSMMPFSSTISDGSPPLPSPFPVLSSSLLHDVRLIALIIAANAIADRNNFLMLLIEFINDMD